MNIKKNKKGDFIITIRANELQANTVTPELDFPDKAEDEKPKDDPFYRMRGSTIKFYKRLSEEFGSTSSTAKGWSTGWICRDDVMLNNLLWEYRLTGFAVSLKKLRDKGLAEIEYNGGGKMARIKQFRLNF